MQETIELSLTNRIWQVKIKNSLRNLREKSDFIDELFRGRTHDETRILVKNERSDFKRARTRNKDERLPS